MKVINLIQLGPNKTILLVKKKKGEVWILPGGKLEDGESEEDCLIRECSEELSGTQIEVYDLFGQFEGVSPNSGMQITARAHFGNILAENPIASAELMDAAFVTYQQAIDLRNLSDITREILERLHAEHLI